MESDHDQEELNLSLFSDLDNREYSDHFQAQPNNGVQEETKKAEPIIITTTQGRNNGASDGIFEQQQEIDNVTKDEDQEEVEMLLETILKA